MKQILLASAAALALTLPAMAQNNDMQQHKPQTQMQGSQSSGQQSHRVNPERLSKQQIRQVQQALNKKGFDARRVDGIWGPQTAMAMRSFQKKQHINADGHLTRQTLSALGVRYQAKNQNAQNQKPNQTGTVGAAPSSTTGSGAGSMPKRPEQSGNSSGKPQQ